MLVEFEARLVKRLPGIKGREPFYFRRGIDGDAYENPEANLALLGFMCGVDLTTEMIKAQFKPKGTL